MKKLFLIITAVLYTLPLSAGFEGAGEDYRASRFEAALQSYEELLKNGTGSPELYYNIGNSYFKLGSYGPAVLYYTKAFNLNPRDADIRKNLTLALNVTGQALGAPNVPEVFYYAAHFFSIDELKAIAALSAWAGALCFIFWLFKRRLLVVCIISFAVFTASSLWAVVLKTSIKNKAVIIKPGVELKSGPGQNFPASAAVGEGYTVKILDEKDNWLHVTVYPGLEDGWTDENSIVLLEEI